MLSQAHPPLLPRMPVHATPKPGGSQGTVQLCWFRCPHNSRQHSPEPSTCWRAGELGCTSLDVEVVSKVVQPLDIGCLRHGGAGLTNQDGQLGAGAGVTEACAHEVAKCGVALAPQVSAQEGVAGDGWGVHVGADDGCLQGGEGGGGGEREGVGWQGWWQQRK